LRQADHKPYRYAFFNLSQIRELGHFVMARRMGMKVEEFGFGFPPRAWGYRSKKSGTLYSINWIPLGGFVRVKGESGEHVDDPDSFAAKKGWQRLLVLVAGVIMNVILAAVLLSIGFMIGLPSVIDDKTPDYARVHDASIKVVSVLPESPAGQAGFMAGDEIISIDNKVFDTTEQARIYITQVGPDGAEFSLKREDNSVNIVRVIPAAIEGLEQPGVGVGLLKTGLISFAPHQAVYHGVISAGQFTYEVVKAFGDLFARLVIKQEVAIELSGPVGIAVLTGKVAALGLVYLIQFTAILSINLAVLNILPFPALDGGRVLFLIIEKVRGRVIDQRVEAMVHNFGFLLLMILVVLVTYRDFVRFGDQIWGTLKSLIGG
ncbi:RIP metalloprotease RseP, partial [Patescibacteria group bacterium]